MVIFMSILDFFFNFSLHVTHVRPDQTWLNYVLKNVCTRQSVAQKAANSLSLTTFQLQSLTQSPANCSSSMNPNIIQQSNIIDLKLQFKQSNVQQKIDQPLTEYIYENILPTEVSDPCRPELSNFLIYFLIPVFLISYLFLLYV